MNALRNLTKEDRIMILAPHPDDETLAAGGLLQKTVGAGAAIRVVFVTDGDNNPWPQRVVEHRWRITAPDRARWGARRRREAYDALACLGVSADSTRFLGYTDQGLSDLLLSGDEEILNTLAAEVAQWRPTLVVTPSALDLHPDHNALAVLLRFAFARLDPEPRGFTEICYLVHGNQPGLGDLDWLYLPLRPVEQARKRAAIHCHTSQLVLSRKRFLAFAQEGERFLVPPSPAACDGHHPVRRAVVTGSVLRLETALPTRSGAGVSMTLYLITYDAAKGGIRCFAELPRKSAEVDVRDAVSGTVIAQAHFCGTRQQGEVVLPRLALFCAERVFVKLGRRFAFFDIAGWRELSVSRRTTVAFPS
jgi:LmbE family N-acetylglucosaminyl deacetylase